MENTRYNKNTFTGKAKTCSASAELKVNTLWTFVLRMNDEHQVEALLNLMVDTVAEDLGYNIKASFDTVRARILSLRKRVLSFKSLREDSLLSHTFKRALKHELEYYCNRYYKVCHKERAALSRPLSKKYRVTTA